MSGINVYTPERGSDGDVLPPMLSFYGVDHREQESALETLAHVSLMLNKYAIEDVLPRTRLLSSRKTPESIILLPVLRAGVAMLPPEVLRLYRDAARSGNTCIPEGTPIRTACIGASRPERPDQLPANIYLNTLDGVDLGGSSVVVLEVGEATFSTGEALSNQLLGQQSLDPRNLVFVTAAACVDQTYERASEKLPESHWIAGTHWLHREKPGPGQFYLYALNLDGSWVRQSPVDWGEAVTDMKGREGSVDYFLDEMITPVVSLTPGQRELLYNKYMVKERQMD